MVKSASRFRLWVQDIWYQNCQEHLTYGEEPYKIAEYWNRYKFWLKREYQHQQAKAQADESQSKEHTMGSS
jgi:hypothetical protein